MKTIKTYPTRAEADLARIALDAAGVPCVVVGIGVGMEGRRYEQTRGVVSRMGGEAAAGAIAASFLQAADVLRGNPALPY